jgi:dTDP-4-dehydrorhamnose 3,5-epimerase
MRFEETAVAGVWIVDVEEIHDERGFFARTMCVREFEERGLNGAAVQCSVSFNHHRGTLRGMHYQQAPATETKLVRCIRGAIHDVVVDLRPDSPTYRRWVGVELTADNRRALYIPELVAHGFQTLTDDSEVFYQIGAFYAPEHARGVRYDDPALAIDWPLPVSMIAEKDTRWPLLEAVEIGGLR